MPRRWNRLSQNNRRDALLLCPLNEGRNRFIIRPAFPTSLTESAGSILLGEDWAVVEAAVSAVINPERGDPGRAFTAAHCYQVTPDECLPMADWEPAHLARMVVYGDNSHGDPFG